MCTVSSIVLVLNITGHNMVFVYICLFLEKFFWFGIIWSIIGIWSSSSSKKLAKIHSPSIWMPNLFSQIGILQWIRWDFKWVILSATKVQNTFVTLTSKSIGFWSWFRSVHWQALKMTLLSEWQGELFMHGLTGRWLSLSLSIWEIWSRR